MVCVAAFIVLCLIGVFVLVLSIWFPKLGKQYLKIFKKAWGCVGKRLTLQKCDTNFKDDIKNSILKKFIIKKPKLVKPIGIGIEILAVIIVFITIFSFVEVVKSGLSLYVLGTCNVSRPDSCMFGEGNVCTVDLGRSNWFKDWLIIFENIPDRIRRWDAADYIKGDGIFYREFDSNKETILNIFEPLCDNCAVSFGNQLNAGFFEKYNIAIIPAFTKGHKSTFIASFILAAHEMPIESEISASWQIITILFKGEYQEGVTWQDALISEMIADDDLDEMMHTWLTEIGYSEEQIEEIFNLASLDKIESRMLANQSIILDEVGIRGVPTTIYNGRKRTGVLNP